MKTLFCVSVLAVSIASGNVQADDFYYVPTPIAVAPAATYYSPAVVSTPYLASGHVVYSTHAVMAQPAYVVPASSYVVSSVPASTVTYSSHMYAPVVPATVSTFYAPATVYRTSGYVQSPYYWGPVPAGTKEIEIEYKRRRHGGYELEVDFDD